MTRTRKRDFHHNSDNIIPKSIFGENQKDRAPVQSKHGIQIFTNPPNTFQTLLWNLYSEKIKQTMQVKIQEQRKATQSVEAAKYGLSENAWK